MIKKVVHKINKLIGENEKNRDLLVNICGAFVAKGGAAVVSFIALPMYIRYFQNQMALGVWYTILSFVTWILSFDLGIGNGLRNKLVEPIETRNRGDIKKYISSSYCVFCVLIFIIGGSGMYLAQYVEWNRIFNIAETIISAEILLRSMRIIIVGLFLQFLLQLINSILYALQKSSVNNYLVLITNVLQLIYVAFFPTKDVESNLIRLSWMYVISVNLPLLLITIWVFTKKLKGCAPNYHFISKTCIREVVGTGNIFFIAQIEYMLIIATTEFLITNLVSPIYVVEYQAYNKIFSLPGTFFTLALTPVWSAVTRAMVQRDGEWIIKIYGYLKKCIILIFAVELLIFPFFDIILQIWVKNSDIQVNYLIMFLFAIFYTFVACNTVFSTFACGLGYMKIQIISYAIGILLKLVTAFAFVKITNSWGGIVLSNIIALLPYVLIQPLFLKKEIYSIEKRIG